MRLRAIGLFPVVTAAARGERFPSSSWKVNSANTHPTADAPSRRNLIGRFAPDWQGGSRSEYTMKPAPVWLMETVDPVAGCAYLPDEQKNIAHRMPAPRNGARLPHPALFRAPAGYWVIDHKEPFSMTISFQ